MLFAINYSTQAAQLVAAGCLQVDRFKCPPWPEMIAEAKTQRPVVVHFNLSAGRNRLQGVDWGSIERWLQETDTPFVNLHLETRSEDLPSNLPSLSEANCSSWVTDQMARDLREVTARFGAERVIAENVPYRADGKVLRPSVEPAVIKAIIEESGCGLLLDIPHARISAHYLGLSFLEYIAGLPLTQLRELHFSGVADLGGRLQDHMPAKAADWLALRFVLTEIKKGHWPQPWLLAFEYGGMGEKFAQRSDPGVIARQSQQIQELMKSKLKREVAL